MDLDSAASPSASCWSRTLFSSSSLLSGTSSRGSSPSSGLARQSHLCFVRHYSIWQQKASSLQDLSTQYFGPLFRSFNSFSLKMISSTVMFTTTAPSMEMDSILQSSLKILFEFFTYVWPLLLPPVFVWLSPDVWTGGLHAIHSSVS